MCRRFSNVASYYHPFDCWCETCWAVQEMHPNIFSTKSGTRYDGVPSWHLTKNFLPGGNLMNKSELKVLSNYVAGFGFCAPLTIGQVLLPECLYLTVFPIVLTNMFLSTFHCV